ncbi:MAG: RNA polymerase sigma-70 factor [Microscillaceae bacterium]|jgi:RNA polymerase sigma-70 factor (ECF subfamily)|nr:RNA polymerase sigma-70 factor [Microscillaceae bacterium]
MTNNYSATSPLSPKNSSEVNLLFQKVVNTADYRAFEGLFHHFYSNLCKYAYRVVHSEAKAEELVSDVFLRIWTHREHINIQSSFQSYLFKSVHNQCLDYLRSQYARQSSKFEEISYHHAQACESPEQTMIFYETNQKIEAAIDKLAPQARLIFRMSRDQGLKYREIAEALNLSIKTIETQMGRALKQLRNSI